MKRKIKQFTFLNLNNSINYNNIHSTMISLLQVFKKVAINAKNGVQHVSKNNISLASLETFLSKPKPGHGKSFRRIVHFPDKYTVEPLNVTNLAGRDPNSGRMIAKGIGGGIKHKYHWIKWVRNG